jgi:serine/threonine protein kinase
MPMPAPPPFQTVRPGQWSVGDLISGRFQVYRKIVSGMGVVYLCYDQQAAEPVAIKTYLDGLAGGPGGADTEFAQLFESEALLWIRLGRHPHVVQARYVLRLNGKPHIFLEYVPGPAGGESTVRRLLRAGRVDVATALLLAIQACAGMEHATQVFPGFVHRDLKPENLLLTPEHVLKITDFGLTKVFADFSGDVGVVAGTPPYMSPEQCLGLPSLDTRSDVYALGVILYELLTGRRPFMADDVLSYLRAHLTEMPPALRDVPADVDRLVLRCLEKSPERRYPSFSALRADLEAA